MVYEFIITLETERENLYNVCIQFILSNRMQLFNRNPDAQRIVDITRKL